MIASSWLGAMFKLDMIALEWRRLELEGFVWLEDGPALDDDQHKNGAHLILRALGTLSFPRASRCP